MAKKKTKLKTPTIALIIAIIVLVIVMLFGTSGQTAKFFAAQNINLVAQKTTPATTNEVQQPLDLVSGTIIEYSANFNMYVVFIRAKNLGVGSVKLSKQNPIKLEMTSENGDALWTNSNQCAVLDAKLQRTQDQTRWGANEYMDCGGVGVASTATKFTFKVDTTNIVAESNETNNELVIGS